MQTGTLSKDVEQLGKIAALGEVTAILPAPQDAYEKARVMLEQERSTSDTRRQQDRDVPSQRNSRPQKVT